jgi:hypothetical protein
MAAANGGELSVNAHTIGVIAARVEPGGQVG